MAIFHSFLYFNQRAVLTESCLTASLVQSSPVDSRRRPLKISCTRSTRSCHQNHQAPVSIPSLYMDGQLLKKRTAIRSLLSSFGARHSREVSHTPGFLCYWFKTTTPTGGWTSIHHFRVSWSTTEAKHRPTWLSSLYNCGEACRAASRIGKAILSVDTETELEVSTVLRHQHAIVI